MFDKVINLRDLENEYDAFLFDIWGVLHEGGVVYPNVAETFNYLAARKIVRIISNAPRIRETTLQPLVSQGINISADHIFTSGETARIMLSKPLEHLGIDKIVIFHIGEAKNTELLQNIDHTKAASISEANLLLLSAFRDEGEDDSDIIRALNEAQKLGLTVLSANPDKQVIHMGQIRRCAGYYSEIYEQIGGKVIYSGKPEPIIFEECFRSYDHKNCKTIMIGDTFYTDIKGARNTSIDSGLVLTGNMGLLINELKANQASIQDPLEAANIICAKQNATPTHLVKF